MTSKECAELLELRLNESLPGAWHLPATDAAQLPDWHCARHALRDACFEAIGALRLAVASPRLGAEPPLTADEVRLLVDYVVDHAADHEIDCPEDDTCDCGMRARNMAVSRVCRVLEQAINLNGPAGGALVGQAVPTESTGASQAETCSVCDGPVMDSPTHQACVAGCYDRVVCGPCVADIAASSRPSAPVALGHQSGAANPMPWFKETLAEVEVGDVVLTERGRLLRVGQINTRPAHVSAAAWQGASRNYVDLANDSSALDVAVVAFYRCVSERAK